MKIVKENESRVIIDNPGWFRIIAWILVLALSASIVLGLLFIILAREIILGLILSISGFFFVLLPMWVVSMGTIIIFDKCKGNIVFKKGHVPVLFWIKRKMVMTCPQ